MLAPWTRSYLKQRSPHRSSALAPLVTLISSSLLFTACVTEDHASSPLTSDGLEQNPATSASLPSEERRAGPVTARATPTVDPTFAPVLTQVSQLEVRISEDPACREAISKEDAAIRAAFGLSWRGNIERDHRLRLLELGTGRELKRRYGVDTGHPSDCAWYAIVEGWGRFAMIPSPTEPGATARPPHLIPTVAPILWMERTFDAQDQSWSSDGTAFDPLPASKLTPNSFP